MTGPEGAAREGGGETVPGQALTQSGLREERLLRLSEKSFVRSWIFFLFRDNIEAARKARVPGEEG